MSNFIPYSDRFMEIQELSALMRGTPTGYSFIHSTKQTSTSNSQQSLGNQENLLHNAKDETQLNTPVIALLGEILYVLGKLNAKNISPYYDLKGIMCKKDGITDIMLCKDDDAAGWSLLRPDNNGSLALIGRSGISELSSVTVNDESNTRPCQLTLEGRKEGEEGLSLNEAYGLVDPETLQDHIRENNPSPGETADNGIDPAKMLGDIIFYTYLTFETATIMNDPEQQEAAYNAIGAEVETLKQMVDQE